MRCRHCRVWSGLRGGRHGTAGRFHALNADRSDGGHTSRIRALARCGLVVIAAYEVSAKLSSPTDRNRICWAVSLSVMVMADPHRGQDQKAVEAGTIVGDRTGGAATRNFRQSGSMRARLRLARKPKLRI